LLSSRRFWIEVQSSVGPPAEFLIESAPGGEAQDGGHLLSEARLNTGRRVEPAVTQPRGNKESAPVAVVAATGTDVDLVPVLLPDRTGATATADCAGDAVTIRIDCAGIGVDTVRWSGVGDPDWERAC
jgi:hypothetical protein